MKKVWITRAEPGGSATAARIRALDLEPVTVPLIETRPLPVEIDLTGVGALAFTSAAGVRAFTALSTDRSLPIYSVGAATAQAAREADFAAVVSANGDVADLARIIAGDMVRPAGEVLHAGATEPAGDLVGDLSRAGVRGRRIAIYETAPVEPSPQFLRRIDSLFAALVHSPSAGRRLSELLARTPAPLLTVFCLSPAVAETLRGVDCAQIFTAALPNEDALLSLLADHR